MYMKGRIVVYKAQRNIKGVRGFVYKMIYA